MKKKDYISVLVNENDKPISLDSDEYKKFSRILMKTPFEDFTEYIYKKLYQIKHSTIRMRSDSLCRSMRSSLRWDLNIAEALLLFKTNNAKIYISGVINDETFGRKGINTFLKKKMEKNLEELYIRHILGYKSESEPNMTIDSRSITPKQIAAKIDEIRHRINIYTKKGAPIKNKYLLAFVRTFADYKEKPTNKDFKCIYDCCDCFGIIDKSQKELWGKLGSKYPDIQYIKSIYRQISNYRVEILPFHAYD